MTDAAPPLIRIVDDDDAVRRALCFMLECEGYCVACYDSAGAFLRADAPSRSGCLVLDVCMPDMTGLQLQQELNARHYTVPIVFLSGHGDIDMAVGALKDGAVDFVQKPVDDEKFLASIERALALDAQRRSHSPSQSERQALLRTLTSRESDVLAWILQGLSNRQIGHKLHISERTVEGHRLRALHKLGVRSVAELRAYFQDADLN